MAEAEDLKGSAAAVSVSERLRAARAGAGLSLAEVSARTRVAERYLAAIEEGRFADLASRTYAIGFARAFARTVGLDEHEIAAQVRAEMDRMSAVEPPRPVTFEPGDPARVPGPRLAWLAALGAVAVAVAVFVLWRSYFAPAVPLSELVPEATATPSAAASSAVVARRDAAPPAAAAGPVVFTALEPGIWVKFYDAAGKQLMQKQMAQGESYTVPADAQGPKLWTARPDALRVTVGGRELPRLGNKPVRMKDVPIDAASLAARGGPAPAASAAPARAGA